jgi:hypothetical protein
VKASGIYVVTYHHLLGEDTSSSTIFMAGGLAGKELNTLLLISRKWLHHKDQFTRFKQV